MRNEVKMANGKVNLLAVSIQSMLSIVLIAFGLGLIFLKDTLLSFVGISHSQCFWWQLGCNAGWLLNNAVLQMTALGLGIVFAVAGLILLMVTVRKVGG